MIFINNVIMSVTSLDNIIQVYVLAIKLNNLEILAVAKNYFSTQNIFYSLCTPVSVTKLILSIKMPLKALSLFLNYHFTSLFCLNI